MSANQSLGMFLDASRRVLESPEFLDLGKLAHKERIHIDPSQLIGDLLELQSGEGRSELGDLRCVSTQKQVCSSHCSKMGTAAAAQDACPSPAAERAGRAADTGEAGLDL